MTDTRTDTLQELGRRARDWLVGALSALFPEGMPAAEPELVPVPVRQDRPRPRARD